MAKINFTKTQQLAIDSFGTNILVSAGAGSGKTAVLSERVLQKIKQGIPIESLVVLTFTNAAAKEMKMRIRKKLRAEERTNLIDKAIQALDASHIQTFDSFALYILKKYGYHLNISKSISIGDPVRMTLRKKAIIDAIFSHYYDLEDPAFLNYIKTYEIKDDKTLKAQIIYFHEQLNMHTNFDDLLNKFTTDYFNDQTFDVLFDKLIKQINETKVAFKSRLDYLSISVESDIAMDYINKIYDAFNPFLKQDDYDTLYAFFSQNPSLPNGSGTTRKLNAEELTHDKILLETEKVDLNKMLKRLKEDYFTKSYQGHKEDFYASSKHIPIIKSLIKTLDEHYINTQIETEQFDFSTVARIAYKIITSNPTIQAALKASIHEVMIDEYQDTNHMQEAFIKTITDQNVYMVGDVKQSIYRFRHAEPKLFTEKYHQYQRKHQGINIDLNANFRSRQAVLDDINIVFKGLMDASIGGVNYDDNQKLKFGNTTYNDYLDPNFNYGLSIDLIDKTSLPEDTPFNNDEIEIFHIAKDIKEKVNHYEVYDEHLKAMRKVTYKDFTILVGVSARFDQIKQILEYHGIPVSILKGEKFINYYDIDFYRHVLKILYALTDQAYYEKNFKHSFLSIARSYVFSFNDDVIIKQVLNFPSALKDLSVNDFNEPFVGLFEALLSLRKTIHVSTVKNLWLKIIDTFDLYSKLILLHDTEQAVKRLEYLTLMIRRLNQEGFMLKDLVDYFDQMIDLDLDVEFDTSKNIDGDYVSLMTIHKSKGLEFPIVYLPQLNHRFNRQAMRDYHFDLELGFLLNHEDNGLTKSFLYPLKRDLDLKDDISERLRVLYVALTRAKDACIIPMVLDKIKTVRFNDEGVILDYDRIHNLNSFYDVFIAMQDSLSHTINHYDASTYPLTEDYQYSRQKPIYKNTIENNKIYETYEASEQVETTSSFSAKIDELLSKNALDNIAFGNLMHQYLELIDFKQDPLAQIPKLTLESSHQDLLKGFFTQPIFKTITIKNVYKEFPFAVEEENGTITGFMDLLLETEDKFIIIDYKLKTIEKDAYYDQIKGYESILNRLSNKTVEGYLYSIIDQDLKKIL